MAKPCCGQVRRRRRPRIDEALPSNPEVPGGVRLIYLGAGRMRVRGKASGLDYHVSDHHRRLTVHPDDIAGILGDRGFILAP